MKAKVIIVLAIVFIVALFAGVMTSMAQGTPVVQARASNMLYAQMSPGGMSNATGAYPPTLTGNRSTEFAASRQSDAQSVCDQVASDNNKSSCTAKKGTGTDLWYCECQ